MSSIDSHQAQRVPGCKVHLGDRPIQITLNRAMGALTSFQKLRLAWCLLTSKDPITWVLNTRFFFIRGVGEWGSWGRGQQGLFWRFACRVFQDLDKMKLVWKGMELLGNSQKSILVGKPCIWKQQNFFFFFITTIMEPPLKKIRFQGEKIQKTKKNTSKQHSR